MTRREDRDGDAELLARIDGQLRTALDLEPPLGFEAGVRRRIEERRERPRSWPSRWGLPVGATLVVATLVLAVASGRLISRPAAPAPEPRPAVAATAHALPPEPPPPDEPSAPRPRPRSRPAEATVKAVIAEVQVPGDQQILVQRLVRQLEQAPLLVASAEPATGGFPEIEIDVLAWEPVTIEPLRAEP